jgi:hypothetical protein
MLRGSARRYARELSAEPPGQDVAALASIEPAGDRDHARWELRYMRLALGILVAERQALEDRLPAIVTAEVVAAFASDPYVAAGNLSIAESQFNARLRAYREAIRARNLAEPAEARIGRALMVFLGSLAPRPEQLSAAATIADRLLSEVGDALQRSFGATTLPEHIAPSEALVSH